MLAKKIALAFGIAVIFPMMIHYGVATFTPEPNWEDYATPAGTDRSKTEIMQGARRAAERHFEQHLFAVAVPLGLAAIIVGAFVSTQAVGTGLMFGGIFSVGDGYFNYWSELSALLKFLSLAAAFIVLIIIGYKKLEKKEI